MMGDVFDKYRAVFILSDGAVTEMKELLESPKYLKQLVHVMRRAKRGEKFVVAKTSELHT